MQRIPPFPTDDADPKSIKRKRLELAKGDLRAAIDIYEKLGDTDHMAEPKRLLDQVEADLKSL